MGLSSAHFTEDELRCRHCGVNLCKQELLDALEEFRAIVGLPVALDCGYRCEIHNAAVGGVPGSEHTEGIAADAKVKGMSAIDMYKAALQVPAFANGGIGVAERQGYIHLDVRSTRARWCYDAAGKSCAWDPTIDQRAA